MATSREIEYLNDGRFTRAKICRLASCEPGVNLAKEEYLFENLGEGELVVALYVNGPAVVIGRNQNPWLECPNAAESVDTPFFRRLSGGGAVYHDLGNLNFSFMAHGALSGHEVTGMILDFLRYMGFAGAVSGEKGDILLDGKKLSGRASYYRGRRVLHHGTLLVDVDRMMMKKLLAPPKGVKISTGAMPSRPSPTTNLCEHRLDIDVDGVVACLVGYLRERWKAHLPVAEVKDFLEPDLYASRLERHYDWQWRFGRTPFFTCEAPDSAVGLPAPCAVRDGMIEESATFGGGAAGRRFALPTSAYA